MYDYIVYYGSSIFLMIRFSVLLMIADKMNMNMSNFDWSWRENVLRFMNVMLHRGEGKKKREPESLLSAEFSQSWPEFKHADTLGAGCCLLSYMYGEVIWKKRWKLHVRWWALIWDNVNTQLNKIFLKDLVVLKHFNILCWIKLKKSCVIYL